jgi:phospholipid transport system substrate-binding protein
VSVCPGIAALALLATSMAASAQGADPAQAPIQQLDESLQAISKGAAELGFQGRADRIGPVLDQVFDLPAMTRLSIGVAWTSIAPAEQAALVAAFRRMTIAQYAGNFDGFSGQAFVMDPKVETRGSDKLVRTTLTQPKQAPVNLAYRLRQSGGRWRVIDIYYQNSISQLATRRADFGRIFAAKGAKGLIADLERQAAKASR